MFHQEFCLYHGTNRQVYEKNKTFYMDHRMLKSLGLDQTKVHGSNDFNASKLAIGVSCAHICIIVGSRCNVGIELN